MTPREIIPYYRGAQKPRPARSGAEAVPDASGAH